MIKESYSWIGQQKDILVNHLKVNVMHEDKRHFFPSRIQLIFHSELLLITFNYFSPGNTNKSHGAPGNSRQVSAWLDIPGQTLKK